MPPSGIAHLCMVPQDFFFYIYRIQDFRVKYISTVGFFLAYIRSARNVESYIATGNPFYQYNPVTGPGFKYIIAKITRLGIHFGYKILDGQTIFIFKYNTNTRLIRVSFARIYYKSGFVLPARQYILIYASVTFGDAFSFITGHRKIGSRVFYFQKKTGYRF